MRVSFNSAVPVNYTEVGYGQAAANIYRSMIDLGYQVTLDDPLAHVQIHWKQPDIATMVNDYNILYFPWESTEFRTGWLDLINRQNVDEVFTTSDWCAKIYKDLGVEKPITVFPHGINAAWETKKRRKRKGPIKYLIVDAEANRKGWQEAFNAFREVFKDDRTKATLTIKTRQVCMARWFDSYGGVRSPGELPNVTVDISKKTNDEMVKMFQSHDVIIYPSYGEGFGLIPFQFIATGGIAIVTEEWCHYKEHLGDFGLRSTYGTTKWQGEHPGQVCYPDQEHLVELIQKSYDEFEDQRTKAFKMGLDLHQKYNWKALTANALGHVENALNHKYDQINRR